MRRDTLYVSDMDGTLLDNNAQISDTTRGILSGLCADGALITVATARTPATVDVLLRGCGMTLPAIVMTGAAMWDLRAHCYRHLRVMPGDVAAAVVSQFDAAGVNAFVYDVSDDGRTLDVYHSRDMNPAEREFYEARRHLSLKRFRLGVRPDSYDRTVLMFATGSAAEIEPLARTLSARTDISLSYYPDNYNPAMSVIEVLSAGVSKADAVSRLARETGARRMVVFGDNLNDLPMGAVADEFIAVGNAHPDVIARATRTIGPNSAHSVARFIDAD